jgi:hypothetical protein
MHAAARGFLTARGLVGDGASQIDPARVFFELTKQDKVARAAALRCEVFIDDLPEILAMPGFPDGMRRILFDPENQFENSSDHADGRSLCWAAITADLARD